MDSSWSANGALQSSAPPAWWVKRFVSLLADHPRSLKLPLSRLPRAAPGKTYEEEAVADRWAFDWPIPQNIRPLIVRDASDVEGVTGDVDFVFCAVDMKKDEIRALEDAYARSETPVVSNNSAHRGTPDVPMIVPDESAGMRISSGYQRKRLGTKVRLCHRQTQLFHPELCSCADGAV